MRIPAASPPGKAEPNADSRGMQTACDIAAAREGEAPIKVKELGYS